MAILSGSATLSGNARAATYIIPVPQLSRTVSLTGQSGNPVALDPLFFPYTGASTTLTYQDLSGQPGFELSTTGTTVWLMTAVPLASYNTVSVWASSTVTLEFEQYIGGSGHDGGPAFWHYSHGAFGTDGNGYAVRWTGSAFTISTVAAGTLTLVNSVAFSATNTFERLRVTLSAGTGVTKNLLLERFTAGNWVTLSNANWNGLADKGSMFGVAWRCAGSGNVLDVRGANGAAGPTVGYSGPSFIANPVGQSELWGYATGKQIQTSPNIVQYKHGSPSTFTAPMIDGWSGAGQVNAWGAPCCDSTDLGCFVTTFASNILDLYPTQLWHSADVFTGTGAVEHAPASSSARYDTATFNGRGVLMTTLFAGDGRTTGQRVFGFYYQGTHDAAIATSQAAYKALVEDVLNRYKALFPTIQWYIGVQGSRNYALSAAHGGFITTSDSQAIRDAQLAIISEVQAKQWFDDSTWVGLPGPSSGWPHSDDGLHPGMLDNNAISAAANTAFRL